MLCGNLSRRSPAYGTSPLSGLSTGAGAYSSFVVAAAAGSAADAGDARPADASRTTMLSRFAIDTSTSDPSNGVTAILRQPCVGDTHVVVRPNVQGGPAMRRKRGTAIARRAPFSPRS